MFEEFQGPFYWVWWAREAETSRTVEIDTEILDKLFISESYFIEVYFFRISLEWCVWRDHLMWYKHTRRNTFLNFAINQIWIVIKLFLIDLAKKWISVGGVNWGKSVSAKSFRPEKTMKQAIPWMPLSVNLFRLESSILTRAKRATNQNNVATE